MSRVRDLASILTASSDMSTDVEVATAVSNHSAASDPHAGYVLESLIDAKGDLIVGSADNTVAKLSTGNSGESIVADSSTSTGLRYTAGNPIPNPVINSCFDIWQRGTSLTTTAIDYEYTADRWFSYTYGVASGRTISRQATGDTTNLPNIQYCARVQRNNGDTNTSSWQFFNPWETANSIAYAGKTVTMSFYARKGANYSPTGSLLRFILQSGTGTDQNPIAGYTGGVDVIDQSVALTTTWQRFSYTATIPATQTEIGTLFFCTPTGTAGAADYYELTGVQIDIGSVALPIRRNGGTIQGELAACQRYYYRTTVLEAYGPIAYGYGSSGTVGKVGMNTTVTMRTKPSAIDYSAVRCDDSSGINITLTSITLGFASGNIMTLLCNASSGFTANRPVVLLSDGSTTSYVGLSAEL